MQYTGQPIPPPKLGYRVDVDPYDPSRWVIKAVTQFGSARRRSGRSRLVLRWYLLWYRTFEPIGGGS